MKPVLAKKGDILFSLLLGPKPTIVTPTGPGPKGKYRKGVFMIYFVFASPHNYIITAIVNNESSNSLVASYTCLS